MKNKIQLITPLVLALGMAASNGAVIAINNGDFESNAVAGFPAADDWQGSTLIALHSAFSAPGNGALGAGFSFTSGNNAPAEQTLATTFVADTAYTLSAFHAYNGSDDPDAIQSIGYRVGGAGAFVPLATIAHDQASPPATWTSFSTAYTSGAAGSELGEAIVIQFQSSVPTGGLWIDSVTLDGTAVPEPSSALFLGLAGLVGLGRRRR